MSTATGQTIDNNLKGGKNSWLLSKLWHRQFGKVVFGKPFIQTGYCFTVNSKTISHYANETHLFDDRIDQTMREMLFDAYGGDHKLSLIINSKSFIDVV